MARDFNQNRNTNAHLGTVDTPIKRAGTFYAQNYGFDGLSYVKVDFPDFVKDFIQGNSNVTEFFVPNDVTSIRNRALSCYPNLGNLTLLNETSFVNIDNNAFADTKLTPKSLGGKIFVVNTWYETYVTNYGELYNFESFASETWYVVSTEDMPTTLTKEEINDLDIPLGFSGLVIPSYFTKITSISIEDLETITQIWLKGCNDLIFDLDELPNGWVYDNGTLYVSSTDYDTFISNHSGYENYISKEYSLIISGSGTLTSEIVENAIEDLALIEIPTVIVGKIIIPVDFTTMNDGSLNVIDSSLPNCDTLVFNQSSISINVLTSLSSSSGKIKKLYSYGSAQYIEFKSPQYYLCNVTSLPNNGIIIDKSTSNLSLLELPNVHTIGGRNTFGRVGSGTVEINMPALTGINIASNFLYGQKSVKTIIKAPLLTTITSGQFLENGNLRMYIDNNECVMVNAFSAHNSTYYFYFKYQDLAHYMTATKWSDISPNLVGYADDIDTFPTFTGYNATWYSNEDCTVTINAPVSGRNYVKLTAI